MDLLASKLTQVNKSWPEFYNEAFYKLNVDVFIFYLTTSDSDELLFLKEGNNYVNDSKNKNIAVEQLLTHISGLCYKIRFDFIVSEGWMFLVMFKESLEPENVPKPNFYLTSEENAYGIIFNDWLHGNVLQVSPDYGVNIYQLKTTKQKRLKLHTNCTEDMSNRCVIDWINNSLTIAAAKGICSRPCLPTSFPASNESLKLFSECETMEEYKCNVYNVHNDLEIHKTCPTHCSITEYSGNFLFKVQNYKVTDRIVFMKYQLAPKKIEVNEEYLLYDEVGLIGSVGGTLGLFIGFSFSGVIFNAIDYLRTLISRGL